MTRTTTTAQPTVWMFIGGSAVAFDTRGEILETADFNDDGTPDWSSAGICDHRGEGGPEGFDALHVALTAGELNAKMLGYDYDRVPEEIVG
jgi:hypothetical protein